MLAALERLGIVGFFPREPGLIFQSECDPEIAGGNRCDLLFAAEIADRRGAYRSFCGEVPGVFAGCGVEGDDAAFFGSAEQSDSGG